MALGDYVDVLTPEFMRATIEERDPEQSLSKDFLYPSLFPIVDVAEDEFGWEIVRKQGILAGFYGLDGRPVPAADIDSGIAYASVARIMAMRTIGHTDVKNLRELSVIASANPQILNSPLLSGPAARHQKKVSQAVIDMDDQIERTLEYMACGALQGEISWPPRDPATGNPIIPIGQSEPYWGTVVGTWTLPFPATHKQVVTTLTGAGGETGGGVVWSDTANADIVADLQVLADLIADTSGEEGQLNLIVSKKVFRQIAANEKILGMLRGTNGAAYPAAYLTMNQVRDRVADLFGWNIRVYEQKWTYNSAKPMQKAVVNKVRYLPENRVIAYVGSRVGNIATSPAKGPRGIWDTGKIPWVYEEPKPPYTTELGVGMNAWPMNTRFDTVVVLDVDQ